MNSRPSSQLPHRVSVVWFSDLVGWSSLTAENEDQAISLVRRFQAAVRAVVRTGLHLGAEVFAVDDGWQGAVDGGDRIRALAWDDVGSILNRGGTVIVSCHQVRISGSAWWLTSLVPVG